MDRDTIVVWTKHVPNMCHWC